MTNDQGLMTPERYPVSTVTKELKDDPRRFLHPDTIARISRLDLRAQHVVEGFISAMHRSTPRDRTNVEKILRRVTESIPSRGMIVIISDLLVDREEFFRGLEMLTQRRHDILIFHVMDDDELIFPFAGTTRFEGMEELPHLLCDPRALRDGYLEALEEYLTEVRRGCTRMGIDYHLVRTSDYLDAVLSRFLFQRIASRAHPVRNTR